MYKAKRKKISLATKKKKGNKKIRLKGVEEIDSFKPTTYQEEIFCSKRRIGQWL